MSADELGKITAKVLALHAEKCAYGCGREAHHILKNGKTSCSDPPQSCPGIRKKMSEHVVGGGGSGLTGWYRGYWCDSSWELAYVIYQLDHGVAFERCQERFEYLWDGHRHWWLPDFKEGDTYVEIKGRMRARDVFKWVTFPHRLRVLRQPEMKPIIEWVSDRYGADFARLFEQERPSCK